METILKLAEKNLEFEASAVGGIPILRTIKEGLVTNKIKCSLWNFERNY